MYWETSGGDCRAGGLVPALLSPTFPVAVLALLSPLLLMVAERVILVGSFSRRWAECMAPQEGAGGCALNGAARAPF